MYKSNTHPVLSFLLPFLVVCMFAVSALLVTSSGLRVYFGIQQVVDNVFQTRTCVSYLTMKLRQVDSANTVAVNGDRLVITEEIEGGIYETHIFLQDGMLRESFVKSGKEPGQGTAIAPAADFYIMTDSPGLVTFTITDSEGNEDTGSVYVSILRGGGG